MKNINTYINESLTIDLIDRDLSFMLDETIDEGKISDGIKKVWKWVKNKFTGKKSKKTSTTVSSDDSSNDTTTKNIEYNFYSYGQIREKILKNNDLNRVNNFIKKEYNSKIRLMCAESDKEIIGCAIFAIPENYVNRPTEFADYEDFGHIFKLQVDEDYKNDSIIKNMISEIYNEIVKKSNCKGLTLDYKEYKSNEEQFEKYLMHNFEIISIEDKKIAVYKKE